MYFKKFSAFVYTLLLMMIVLATSSNLFAEMQKPEKFEAQLEKQYLDSTFYVDAFFNWMYSEPVDGYNVYIAYKTTNNYDDFELLQTINYPNDSLIYEKDNFWYAVLMSIDTKKSDSLSFYITAFKNGQTTEPSNISFCTIYNENRWYPLEFTTTPSTIAKLNKEYVYEFDVKTDLENPTYTYELYNQPEGSKFDKENKKITFTPTENGIYYFDLMVSATDAHGNVASNEQYWEVRVIECEIPSTISGTVKNEDGEYIKWCYASIYKLYTEDTTKYKYPLYITQISFENGVYEFKDLDKGTYYIQVYGIDSNQSAGYLSEWYENAHSIEKATPIVLGCNDSATINFVLEKMPVPKYDKVSGYVKNAATNEPIENAEIDFYGEDVNFGQYLYFTANSNADGYYEISLQDSIEYIAVAYVNQRYDDSTFFPGKNSYMPQFWEGKTDPTEADKIKLTGDLDNINFNLTKIPEPNYYKVSGYVLDASTKQAIENAEVDFMGQDSIYGQYISNSAFTNGNGYYEITLPDGVEYTAYASAGYIYIDSTYSNQNIYIPIYWDNKTDPAEADKIKLTGDLSNINFNLTKFETYENEVNGYVKNEEGEALQNVLMIAYIIDGSEDVNNMYRGYLAMTDNNGYFEMNNLYPAEYVLLAVPAMNIKYAPGFYKENDVATLTWEDATKVTVGNSGTYGAYNVKLQLFEKAIGIGIVKGIVRAEKGRVKSGTEFQGSGGLQGVQVHMVDMSGNRVKSTETDKTGSYEFSGLAKGTYKVVIDKIGYKSDSFNVTIDDESKLIDKTVTLAPSGATAVEDNTFLMKGISVFPNPAVNSFTVKFNGNGNVAKMNLFDAKGNIVLSNDISTNLGENNLNINTENVNSGTYFIRIEMNNSAIFTPVIIAK